MKRNSSPLASFLAATLLMAFALPAPANASVHDASNGTITFASGANSFAANVVQKSVTWNCYNQLPEFAIGYDIGGIRTGIGRSGGIEGAFELSHSGNSYSPRFQSSTFGSNATVSISLVFNSASLVQSIAAGDAVSISYDRMATTGFYAAPNSGGASSTYDSYRATSFSGLVFNTNGLVSEASTICAAPVATSVQVNPAGTRAILNLSSSVGYGAGGPASDFVVTANGVQIPLIGNTTRSNRQISLTFNGVVLDPTTQVTVAKVSSNYDYGFSPFLANFGAGSVPNYSPPSNNSTPNAGSSPASISPQIALIKYSGPEFTELSLKPALAGSSATLQGRKLDQISSVTIDGKAAVLSNATDKSVNIGLPAGLAPGVYDLVVTTANHGKLTHMNAIRIREELPATSLTIQGTGVLTGEEFKKLTAFARTQNPDMNTVTCIVNSGSEGKSFMQARALCDRIAATSLNVKTTKIEARSTVKSSAVFARAVFSSVQ